MGQSVPTWEQAREELLLTGQILNVSGADVVGNESNDDMTIENARSERAKKNAVIMVAEG